MTSPDIEPDVEESLREMERDHDDWPEGSDHDPTDDPAPAPDAANSQ